MLRCRSTTARRGDGPLNAGHSREFVAAELIGPVLGRWLRGQLAPHVYHGYRSAMSQIRRTVLTTVRRFASFPLPLRQLSPLGLKGISAFPESSELCAHH